MVFWLRISFADGCGNSVTTWLRRMALQFPMFSDIKTFRDACSGYLGFLPFALGAIACTLVSAWVLGWVNESNEFGAIKLRGILLMPLYLAALRCAFLFGFATEAARAGRLQLPPSGNNRSRNVWLRSGWRVACCYVWRARSRRPLPSLSKRARWWKMFGDARNQMGK